MTAVGDIEAFITAWRNTGGSELANTQSFLNGLCVVLGVAPPNGSRVDDLVNDYVFERRVFRANGDGTRNFGRIDCYKRDCFILEAKQGSDAENVVTADDPFGQTISERLKRGTARRGTPGWAKAMRHAKEQAEGYAGALPRDHGRPPFLLIVDVGYCIEVYADFSDTGISYAPFPDRAGFRIMLDDLCDREVRARLRAIWKDPYSLDPSIMMTKTVCDFTPMLVELSKRQDMSEYQFGQGVTYRKCR